MASSVTQCVKAKYDQSTSFTSLPRKVTPNHNTQCAISRLLLHFCRALNICSVVYLT